MVGHGARPGHPGGQGAEMPEISATAVRAMLARHDPAAEALVPRSVLSYIERHGLYQ